MKKIILVLMIFMVIANLNQKVYAAEGDLESLLNALPNDAYEIMEDSDLNLLPNIDETVKKIIEKVKIKLEETIKTSVLGAASVITVSSICALVVPTRQTDGKTNSISLAGVAALCISVAANTESLVGLASQTTEELYIFSTSLMPVLTTAAASAGAVASSSAKYAATTLFVGAATSIIKKIIIPMIYVFIGVSAVASVFDGVVEGLADLIKKSVSWILSAVAIIFTIYISLTGAVLGTADETAIKLTKAAVSGVLPVVGGIISDAAEAVVSGAAVLKTSVSTFGMLSVCAVCAAPFFILTINILIYKIAVLMSSSFAPKQISKFSDSICDALVLALGSVGVSAIMLFVSIVSFMKTVVT